MEQVTVSCPVYPSEDPDKVRAAVLSIFPTAQLTLEDGQLSGPADLENFGQLIRRQKVLDAARAQMVRGAHGSRRKTVFRLNKQVATVGKVSFIDYAIALGTIDVCVQDDDLEAVIDRVAPETVDGEEVHLQ